MATLAARDGAFESAIDLYKKVLDQDPHFAPAYNGIGLVQESWSGGSISEAIRYFALAVEMDPGQVEFRNNLGRSYYTQGNFSQAEKMFASSLKIAPDQPDINLALAWVYLLGQSDAEKAVPCFQRVIALADNAMSHYGLGLSYLIVGDKMLVLGEITALRRWGKEAEALRLEQMLREGIQIGSKIGTPLITGKDFGESIFDKELAAVGESNVDADKKTQGIQVRLKGPLWAR